jgi:hypothetical protein
MCVRVCALLCRMPILHRNVHSAPDYDTFQVSMQTGNLWYHDVLDVCLFVSVFCVCVCARGRARLPACLLVCLPACVSECACACLRVCVPACLCACLCAYSFLSSCYVCKWNDAASCCAAEH